MHISDIMRGEIGASEQRIVAAFALARRAAPCIVFIDEFQALFNSRTSSSGEDSSRTAVLASCFDDLCAWNRHAGPESLVTVVAATNEPWAIDRALLRPGRLDPCVFVGPLDATGREKFVERMLRDEQRRQTDQRRKLTEQCADVHVPAARHFQLGDSQQVQQLAKEVLTRTEGFTGADMSQLLERVALGANMPELDYPAAVRIALDETRASVSPSDAAEYTQWWQRHLH